MTRSFRRVVGCCAVAASFAVLVGRGSGAELRADAAAVVRGIVRPVRQASIGTDLPARISRLHFREAEAFKQGNILVSFDCERMRAEQAASLASAREMKLTFESQAYLERRGAVGKLDVEIARARFDKADAEAGALGARVKQCEIVAPFDGRVTELKINEHELPSGGQPFISIVEESRFEIDLIVPSQSLRYLRAGATFEFRIDETARAYRVELLRTGAIVDPVSQSVKVIAGFVDPDAAIIAGMSGSAAWPPAEAGQ